MLAPASPETAGMSKAAFDRLESHLKTRYIDAGRFPGTQLLVYRRGQVVHSAVQGFADIERKTVLTEDTIFRIYSMTKPITSVAFMMLFEEGRVALDEPVHKYIPEWNNLGVFQAGTRPAFLTKPPSRPMLIVDLLRHTSGLTYGFYGDSAARKRYANSDLFEGDLDNALFVERLAKLPLAEQPGTLWDYGHSTDVLGRVIEVVSGQSLFAFEKQRLLDPLGMTETAFYVADATKRPLIAEPLPTEQFARQVAGLISDPTIPRRWESGGAGMFGTTGDYARFAQMLLNGGILDGRNYLKPETVALMTSDHIGPETKIARDYFYFPGGGSGFGLGFAVRTAQLPNALLPASEYRWDGVGGTFFFIDPKDDMFAIFMVQAPSQLGRIEIELKTLIYQALAK
jgi:CubicO group peptidase (beta-lactamase class C family)